MIMTTERTSRRATDAPPGFCQMVQATMAQNGNSTTLATKCHHQPERMVRHSTSV
jgi:hypothetical protein